LSTATNGAPLAYAERSLLGALLRHNPTVADVAPVVRAEDFYADSHQKVFASVLGLWSRGQPSDLPAVADDLQRRGWLEDAGGCAGLADLWEQAPTGGEAPYHAAIVRDRALLRRLAQAAAEIQREATDPSGPASDVLAEAERRILEVARLGLTGEARPVAHAVDRAYDALDARQAGHSPGLGTGFLDWDRLTCGLHPGQLVVLAARPSAGKTALALAVAAHAALDLGLPVLFASLEQAEEELAERLLCARGRVDSHRLRRGALCPDEVGRLQSAGEDLRAAPLWIDDAAEQHAFRVGANARRLARKGLRLVVVDYLQLMKPDSPKDSREEQVAGCSRRLKALAKDLRVPVLALAQLNREVEHRQGRPRLADLRSSGQIEQDADVVLLLHAPEPPAGAAVATVEVLVAKQRNGPRGEFALQYERGFMRFGDYAPDFADHHGGNGRDH
jgi:replicative DNA helicase